MLAVLLAILKWPGIILVCLLGLILVLVACILFVPIRYRLHLCSENEGIVTGRIHWLFHVLHISLAFQGIHPVYCMRVLGIPVKRSGVEEENQGREVQEREKKKDKDAQAGQDRERGKNAEGPKTHDSSELEMQEETWYPEDEWEEDTYPIESEKKMEEEIWETDVEEEKTSILSKIKHFFLSIQEKFGTIKDKVVHMIGNIRDVLSGQAEEGSASKIIKVVKDENTGELIRMLWSQVTFLGKHVLPTSMKGWVHFGMSDPSLTGQILGGIAVLFAIRGKGFTVIPDFDQAILEEDLMIKGKVRLIFVVVVAVKVLFSRQWRHFRKQWDG